MFNLMMLMTYLLWTLRYIIWTLPIAPSVSILTGLAVFLFVIF